MDFTMRLLDKRYLLLSVKKGGTKLAKMCCWGSKPAFLNKENNCSFENLKGLFRGDGSLIICIPQERIRGDSALPENLYNLVRFKFENVHRVKYSLDSITLLLSEVGFLFQKSKYIHAFRPGKDQKSFANHSLVVFCELAQSKKVN